MFGRKKKARPAEPSPLTGRRPSPASQNTLIDSLAERWNNGDSAAQTEYWDALFDLPEWHFIGRGSLESGVIQPFMDLAEGNRPMIQAFTSAERAHEAIETLDLSDTAKSVVPGVGYARLTNTPESAIRSYAPYSLSGAVGMMFDSHVFGGFALLTNLPGMWEHSGRKRIDDIVLPAAPGEFAHLARIVAQSQGDDQVYARARVLTRLCHLDKIGVVTESADNKNPCVLSIDNKLYLPVVTSPDEVKQTKQFVEASGGGEPGVAGCFVRDYINIVSKLREEAGVEFLLLDAGASNHAERIETLLTVWHGSPGLHSRQVRAEQLINAAAASQ